MSRNPIQLARSITGHSRRTAAPCTARGATSAASAEHGADVEDVRADDVAHGDVRRAPERRDDAHHEFRQRRAGGHDRQPDDGGRQTRDPGDGGGAAHQRLAAAREEGQPEDDQEDGGEEFHDAEYNIRPAGRRACAEPPIPVPLPPFCRPDRPGRPGVTAVRGAGRGDRGPDLRHEEVPGDAEGAPVLRRAPCEDPLRGPAGPRRLAGELRRFAQKFGVAALVDRGGKRFAELGLRSAALSDERWLDRLADDPLLLRTPLARCQQRLTIGPAEDTWKEWVTE